MSSLAISLLLLVALAVGVALFYNLRQSRLRLRWPDALRRPRGAGGRSSSGRDAAGHPARGTASGTAAPALRGEPRLAGSGAAPPEGPDTTAGEWPEVVASAPAAAGVPPAYGDPAARRPSSGPSIEEGAGPEAAAVPGATWSPARDDDGSAGAVEPPVQPLLSELCDCIVEIPLRSAWPGERLIALAQRFRRAGAKPVAIEGRRAGASADQWGALSASRQYEALRAGILLANRHGPLNAMEYSEFVTGVQTIADAVSALADTPDMAAVLARARDLDATCAQLDAQIGLNVEAPEALGPAQLAALAAPLAIVERGSNRYARLGDQGEVVFSVALADTPNRLTFLLDVPRSSPDSDAWGRMLDAARACAQHLGGRLVDDGGRPLADSSLAQIGRQLVQRYESLEAIGVPAGSALALRVFN